LQLVNRNTETIKHKGNRQIAKHLSQLPKSSPIIRITAAFHVVLRLWSRSSTLLTSGEIFRHRVGSCVTTYSTEHSNMANESDNTKFKPTAT